MTIAIKERRLLATETIKKIQCWRVMEKKMPNYVTIEGEFQSNRLYTVFFLMETDNFGLVNLGPVVHRDLFMDYYHFYKNDITYVLMHVSGYNKIAIDAAKDHMHLLKNTNDIKYIKNRINIELFPDHVEMYSLIRFIETQATFD